MKKRIVELDIIKGLCIIFMVIGHTSWKYMNILLLFHMAVFFMVSGYLFQENNADSFKSIWLFTVKRLKQLYIPWVIAQSVYMLLNNLFLWIGFYTSDPAFLTDTLVKHNFGIVERMNFSGFIIDELKILLMQGGTQFGGSLWFLRSLLLVELMFAAITYLGNKSRKTFLVPILVLVLFALGRLLAYTTFGKFDILRIEALQVCIPISAYYMGWLARKYKDKLTCAYKWWGGVLAFCVLFILLEIDVHIDMSNGTMTNSLFYLFATLSGFVLCMSISKLIIKVVFLMQIFSFIGRNTLPILILHLVVFKSVTAIQIFIYENSMSLPEYALASFPTLLSTGVWPYIYTIVGVAIPLGLNTIYKRKKSRIINK